MAQIKGSFSSRRGQDNYNPYSVGSSCGNCLAVLCGPVEPSLINRRGIIIPDPPETDKYGALGTTISSQTHVSPNGVKETVHRFDKKMPPKLTEDSVTDSGAEQEDTLKPDSEKGIVKLSSV